MKDPNKKKPASKPIQKKDGRANNGGKREGAGNSLIYGETTVTKSICIPGTKENEIMLKIREILKPYLIPKKP